MNKLSNIQISRIVVLSGIVILIALCFLFAMRVTARAKKTPLSSLTGGETGKIYYESANFGIGYYQLFSRIPSNDKVVVFGDLKIPKGIKDKVPAIVFVQGSAGWHRRHKRWLKLFNKMGIATFRINSFSSRKVTSTIGKQYILPTSSMIADSYNALKLLSTHPKIDRERIGIMGSSKGGIVALYSAYEPIRQSMVNGDLKFALHIPLYPFCMKLEKVQMTGAPILILIGEKDRGTPAKFCTELIKDFKDADYDTNIIVYPDAYHAFDGFWDLSFIREAYSREDCRVIIKANGETIETTTGIPLRTPEGWIKAFIKCGTPGTHIGRNSAARKKAYEDVKNFVTKTFGLEH
jgi:dienelactone hydrolase